MIRTLASLALFLFSTGALAEDPAAPVVSPPIVVATGSMGYSVSLSSGDAFPPTVGHGLGVIVPIGDGWSYYTEAAFTTSLAELQPGFLIITGPSRRVSDRLTLGVTGMYKIVPSFDEATPTMNILSGSAAVTFPTTFGSLSIPCGPSYNVTTVDPGFGCSAKASVRLK